MSCTTSGNRWSKGNKPITMMKKRYTSVFCMGGNTSAAGLKARKLMFAGGATQVPTSGDDPDDINTDLAIRGRMLQFNTSAALTPGMGPDANVNAAPVAPGGIPAKNSSVFGAFSKAADQIAPFASNIVNATRTPPMPKVPGMVNPVTLSRIRLDATRAKADSAARVQDLSADRSLDEQSAAAVRSSNLARNLDTQGQISEQEAFLNARQKAEAAGMNLNVDAMNTSAMNKYSDELVGRGNAIQRTQSENMSNASDKFIGMRNEQAKANLDMQKLTTLSQIWKESGVYDRMMKRMKAEGNTDPTGILHQSSWIGDAMEEANGTQPVKAMGGKMRKVYATGGGVTPGGPVVTTGQQTQDNLGLLGEQADVRDLVAQSVQTGTNPMQLYNTNIGTGRSATRSGVLTNPAYHTLYDAATVFNARTDLTGKSPEERLAMFYDMPSNNPSVDAFKQLAKNTGHTASTGATADSHSVYAARGFAFGGFKNTVAKGYLNPFGNTRSLGLGPGIEKDKFNPAHIRHTQHNLLAHGGVIKTDGASDVNFNWTNYGDATPDLYREGGPFQEEWKHGGKLHLAGPVVDHSMWKEPYKENALTNNDPNPYQMGDGGTVPPGGGLWAAGNRRGYVDSTLKANDQLDWVKRLYEKGAPSTQIPGQPDRSTHFMSDDGKGYVFPAVVRENGQLRYLGEGAEDYARRTNTGIQFPKEQGDWFAANGYKLGTGVNNSIDRKGVPYNNPGYQVHALGGEFSGEATARDMSRWNRKVWRDGPDAGMDIMAKGGWIAKAVNPAHKGYCTPMTKATCTPRRKAFAMTMKKHHGFH